MTIRIRKNQLGPMTFIAKGGVGQVFRLHSAKINGLPPSLAYKELLPELQGSSRTEAIHAMEHAVALREAMDPLDRAALDQMSTWPQAIVEERGTTVGILMPLIPAEFFTTTNPPDRPSKQVVFAYAFLSAAETYVQRMGINRSLADDPLVRMSLAAQLAFAVGLLHKHGIVYGDLSLQNVAISLAGTPRLLLLDCDAAAALTDTARKQYHSPAFTPPENASGAQREQDLRTDVYKLGLCILRGLVTGKGVTQLSDPGALTSFLDSAGVDLVRRALSPNRAARPTAKELCLYLEGVVLSKARPPVIHSAQLDRRLVVRGQDVLVTWNADGASKMTIRGVNGLSEAIADPSGHPYGYAITPATSGPIHIEATNRYGTVSTAAGFIDVYDLPRFEMSKAVLPRPVVPSPQPVHVPTVLATLPPRPAVSAEGHPGLRLRSPDLSSLHDAVHAGLAADPVSRVAGSHSGSGDFATHTVQTMTGQVADLVGARAFVETAQSTHAAMSDAIRNVMSDVSDELHRRIIADPPEFDTRSRASA